MEWVELLLPYAKSLGAVTFAAAGNCWGGYMVMRLSSYAEFKAGKHSFHAYTVVSLVGELRSYLQDLGEASVHFRYFFWFNIAAVFLFLLKGHTVRRFFDFRFFQQSSSRDPRKSTNAVSILMILMKIRSYFIDGDYMKENKLLYNQM
jgi:hypothetical protein